MDECVNFDKSSRMRALLSILVIAICFSSCGKKSTNITLQTYSSIDSSTGNYTGTWQYTHRTWQNHILITNVDSSYPDIIAINKINQDSLLISSKMGSYRFKFDPLGNGYANSTLISYSLNVVSHTISATGNSNYWDNHGNADTAVYQFSGKR